jgi:hypothetical protein
MAVQKIILTCCLICFVSSGLAAQQTVPPPPKPADDGPSLEVTMKFIQDKLNDIGPLKWTVTSRNADAGDENITVHAAELAKVVADPQRCTISYHSLISAGGVNELAQFFLDMFPARPAAQAERGHRRPAPQQPAPQQPPPPGAPGDGPTLILSLKEVKKIMVKSEEEASQENAGSATQTVRPSIFQITVQQTRNRNAVFHVDDEELANRLARAINHSVELCTPDKAPEPF